MKGMFILQSRLGGVGRSVVAALLCAAALAGCGGSAPLFTSDGRPTTAVQCSAAGSWNNCIQNARGICEGDIDMLDQSDANGAHKLLFACKAK